MDYATYSPEDDKIRVYFSSRRPAEDLEPLKAAGFGWAGKAQCWYATWTPKREDVALAAAGVDAFEDEPTSLAQRAEDRADRFGGYVENATAEAAQRDASVQRLAECMNGQPILIGHHSEKRHRRDYQRMWDNMGKAAQARKRADYWESRASGSVNWARYKDKPGVRARRIKGLEAEARKVGRSLETIERGQAAFHAGATLAELCALANDGRNGFAYGLWNRLDKMLRGEESTDGLPAMIAETQASLAANHEHYSRWASHLAGRIAYEREQLRAQGGEGLLDPKPRSAGRAAIPLRNMPGGFPMTKAEYAAKNKDYKACRVREDEHGKYRIRTAMVRSDKGGLCLSDVTLTDAPLWSADAKGER